MIKVCAKQVRETNDAYLLLFSFTHKSFEKIQLKPIYYLNAYKFNWEIWVPKKYCKTLSRANGFYLLDDVFFNSVEKRIEVTLNNDESSFDAKLYEDTTGCCIDNEKPIEKIFSFSAYKQMFTNIKLTADAASVYSAYLQQELSGLEEQYNRHPYDNWLNWHH